MPDDANDADSAKHASEDLDQATRELEALDANGQERVLGLLGVDKPPLELLQELLEKLQDGKIPPAEYRKLVALLQNQSRSENTAKRARDAPAKDKGKEKRV